MQSWSRLVIGAMLLTSAPLAAQARAYSVGFRVDTFRITDPASTADSVRRARAFVWYPAVAGSGVRLRFRDYVGADRPDIGNVDSLLAAQLTEYADRRVTESAARRAGDARVAARLRASTAAGSFPIVVLGNGLTSPAFANSALAESLAVRGFVVLSLASPLKDLDYGAAFSTVGVERIALEMHRAIDAVAATPSTDSTRVGVVGWSVGGVAQALLQMTDSRVRALVSLESGSGYAYGAAILDSSRWTHRSRATVPIFELIGLSPSRFVIPRDSFYRDSLSSGPAFSAAFQPLSHPDVTSLRILSLNGFPRTASRVATAAASAASTRMVVEFLVAALGREPTVARLTEWAQRTNLRDPARVRRIR